MTALRLLGGLAVAGAVAIGFVSVVGDAALVVFGPAGPWLFTAAVIVIVVAGLNAWASTP